MENEKEKLSSGKNPCPWDNWTINQKRCTTCCECVDACERGLLFYNEQAKVINIRFESTCTHCGDCASACAFDAILLT